MFALISNSCTYSPSSAHAATGPAGHHCPPKYTLLSEGGIIQKLSLCLRVSG